jgi:hypothetical protein
MELGINVKSAIVCPRYKLLPGQLVVYLSVLNSTLAISRSSKTTKNVTFHNRSMDNKITIVAR